MIWISREERRLAKLVAAMIEKAANELDAVCINDDDVEAIGGGSCPICGFSHCRIND